MVRITIDGQEYQVAEGQNLLQACLGLGLDLPYFCWHPALGSVGACRQCAVLQYQNQEDNRGRLVMGCMTPVEEGQILSLEAEPAKQFRAGIIEALMTNHPHDCPVCEEGGECHLQDMTVMSGHHRRRYRGHKRTFHNQQLGPFINHEMNRCITCFRCLRYYRDYAGGSDLHAMASRNHTYFGRFEDGPLDSPFAGNLVEVCPTGVFTDKPLSEDYSRKWDLACAPSVCVHCSLGCNISPGERYGRIKRVHNRYHHAINGYFLCDRGRFGYAHVNRPDRPRQPQLRHGDQWQPLDPQAAHRRLHQLLDDAALRWVGIGSPRATLETNRALQRLVGPAHFYSGLGAREERMNRQLMALMGNKRWTVPSLQQVEQADAVLILGEDISHSAPRLALAVRQAIRGRGRERAAELKIPPWQAQAVQIAGQEAGYPLFISHSGATGLDAIATGTLRARAEAQARFGCAVAACLDGRSASAPLAPEQQRLAEETANALLQARQPLLIAGPSAGSPALLEAAERLLTALCQARGTHSTSAAPMLAPVFAECNSLGLTLLQHNDHEQSLETLCALAERGPLAAIIVENDLFRRAPHAQVEQLLSRLSHCVVIDCLDTPTLADADLQLPAASFAETQGTLINNEGRGQALLPVSPPNDTIRPGWQWLQPPGETLSVTTLLAECGEQQPALAGLSALHPPATAGGVPVARMPHRYSGRTAINAHLSVHEPQPPADPDSPLAYTMEGLPVTALQAQGVTAQMPYSWAPGWNSNQSIHKFQQEIGGPLQGGDSGLRLHWPPPPQPAERQGAADQSVTAATALDDALWVEPQPQVFGGEELSNAAPAIQQRAGLLHAHLHPDDAATRGLQQGDRIQLPDIPHPPLAVQLDLTLATGVVQLPLPAATLPLRVQLQRLGPDPLIASDRERPHD